MTQGRHHQYRFLSFQRIRKNFLHCILLVDVIFSSHHHFDNFSAGAPKLDTIGLNFNGPSLWILGRS
jgi:hypothetical protein